MRYACVIMVLSGVSLARKAINHYKDYLYHYFQALHYKDPQTHETNEVIPMTKLLPQIDAAKAFL